MKVNEDVGAWYDDEAFNAKIEDFDEKNKQIKVCFEAIEKRIAKYEKVSQDIEKFPKELNQTKTYVDMLLARKPWIAQLAENFTQSYEDASKYFAENVEKHKGSIKTEVVSLLRILCMIFRAYRLSFRC